MHKNIISHDAGLEHEFHLFNGHQEPIGPANAAVDIGGSTVPQSQPPALPSLQELEIVEDRSRGVVWQYLAPRGRPRVTLRLLQEMTISHDHIRRLADHEGACPFQYLVIASRMPGAFNLGGDLPRFIELIRRGDRAGLLRYAHACIDVQYQRASNLGLPIRTVSLVQGDALGGGFESVLAGDVIIAERGAKFGLPEILFSLFPGMGAYSFLSRRVTPAYAERLILSGRVYTAEEMHEAGIVDVLVEDGEGESAVYDFIHRERRQWRAHRALHQIRQRVNPVTEGELRDITEIWVDTALTLGKPELRVMERLAQAQDRRFSGGSM